MMRAAWRFLTSITVCAWAGLAFCVAGAVGSVVLGRYPEIFSDMDAQVFAGWFARMRFAAPGPTPWGAPYAVFDANRDPAALGILGRECA
jgi:hypothetical protein